MLTGTDLTDLLSRMPCEFNAYRAAHPDEPIVLFEADLAWRDLGGVNFEGADLRRIWLEGCNLVGARFDRALMDYANVRSSKLRGATFRGASLRWATFQHADLQDTVFDGANLRRVVFCDANLTGAAFRNANFAETDLRWATYDMDSIESDLAGACIR